MRLHSLLLTATLVAMPATGLARMHCGDTGAWVQILGSGAVHGADQRASAGVLLWLDGAAVALVDPGPGSALRMEESEARFADLDVIALTQVDAAYSADLVALLDASREAGRTERLTLLGPDGRARTPGTKQLVERLIGEDGAWPRLAPLLHFGNDTGYKLTVEEIASAGRRRWGRFGTERVRVAAIPVDHGDLPALAYRVQIGTASVVVTGDTTVHGSTLAELARGATALVVHHVLPEGARGEALEEHMTPTQIGRLAADAGARFVVISGRGERTFGRESMTRTAIEAEYAGTVLFANDLQCWGL